MTQLISNVLMQPNLERTTQPITDAVVERPQRPLTLIEKLEDKLYRLRKKQRFEEDECLELQYKDNADGFKWALDIAKQHQAESGWIACSDRMPEDEQEVLWWNEAYQCLVIGEWRESRELVFYRNGDYADLSEFFHWQYLPKSPYEARA